MNYKRKKSRSSVRCSLCTDNRENIGGDRLREEKDAKRSNTFKLSGGGSAWEFCSECDGSGVCGCKLCEQAQVGCGSCLGSKVVQI